MHVLVAEPSRTLAALIRATLAELGCDIETATDGSSAMAIARGRMPDALIVDVALPGLDGYALVHAIKSLPGGSTLPALMLTPDHVVVDNERLAYVGVNDVLTKPFERAVLIERFESLIGKDFRRARASQQPSRDGPAPASRSTPTEREPDLRALTQELEGRMSERLSDELLRRLPQLVSASVEQLLVPIVRERLDELARDRLASAFDRSLKAAVQDLAEPARIDAIIRQSLEGKLSAAVDAKTAAIAAQLEAQTSQEIGTFIREDLQKRLERQAEQIIWKVVPALAEELVKEEIKRLTEA